MAQQLINLGALPTGIGGDTPRTAFQKVNDNTTELYGLVVGTGAGTSLDERVESLETAVALTMGRNRLINGNFDYWQRGLTSAAAAGSRYLADRWYTVAIGSTAAISRQTFTPGQTDVPGEPKYFQRVVVASVAGASNAVVIQQKIEGARTLAGKNGVGGLWLKADANRPACIEVARFYGTGGSPSAQDTGLLVKKVNLTTAWQFFSASALFPTLAGKTLGTNGNDYLEFNVWLDAGSSFNARTSSLGQQSGTFDIAQVQLEEGTVPTEFDARLAAIELTLCKRYYENSFPEGTSPGNNAATGLIYPSVGWNVTATDAFVKFEVSKRASPTMTFYGPTEVPTAVAAWALYDGSNWQANNAGPNGAHRVNTSGCTVATNTNNLVGNGVARIVAGHWAADAEL